MKWYLLPCDEHWELSPVYVECGDCVWLQVPEKRRIIDVELPPMEEVDS